MIKQFILELLATVLSFNPGPQLAYATRHPAKRSFASDVDKKKGRNHAEHVFRKGR